MPRLPGITPRQLIKILRKLRFQVDHSTGSHFVFYNSQTKKRAVVPYHAKDLPKGTILNILKEAGITRKEIEALL